MLYYQIVCEPDNETPRALSALTKDDELVIAVPKIDDARQLWQLVGFAAVNETGGAVWNAFYLLNKDSGRVAMAPHDGEHVKSDTQGVSQAVFKDGYDAASGVRLWTLDHAKDAFAIRPQGNEHQNLNAWDKSIAPNTRVGIYKWGGGKPNEVWSLIPTWLD